jgi:hypothetical protein
MAHCRVEEGDFRGWRAAFLKNDLVTLAAVPDIGGRIMAYSLGPYPYLYVDRDLAGKLFSPEENQGDGSLAAWKNYGGDKTWPAPQGWENDDQWHGPPDPVLDTGRYRLDVLSSSGASATVRMISPDTSSTGVQITRQATLHAESTRVTLDLSFRNVAQRPVRWSIWDVVQLQAERVEADGRPAHEPGCVVTAPLNPNSRFPRHFQVMFGDPANPQWQAEPGRGLFFGNYQWEIGKVGLDSRAGWAAFANTATGYAFAARFVAYPDQEYPDDGAAVEFWTVGRGKVANLDYEKSTIYLMECEMLSPFYRIEPGQVASFRIEWGACRCPGPVLDVTEAGCAGRKLQVERQGDYAHLAGAFGVFDLGQLELVWNDRDGRAIEHIHLGPVTPLAAVLIDRVCRVPPAATEAQLAVKEGDTSRILACEAV